MSTIFFVLVNIGFVFFVSNSIFNYLSEYKVNYITHYKKVFFIFTTCSSLLLILYFVYLKQFFATLSVFPFVFLFLFYLLLLGVYWYMKPHRTESVVKKYEAKKLYFTSMSYRYIVSKSANIFFQQVAVLCVIAFLKGLGVNYGVIAVGFALAFGVSHFSLYRREGAAMIARVFIPASARGGFIFAILLLNIQYGIVYTYILHWSFYLFLGVFLNLQKA